MYKSNKNFMIFYEILKITVKISKFIQIVQFILKYSVLFFYFHVAMLVNKSPRLWIL